MASDKTLNAKNLAALGAERLAELLLELVTGNATAKRRLRLELASRNGGGDVAAEIRKRLTAIGKSRSFVDWHKIRPFAADLDMQHSAILNHVAPTQPDEAMNLLWRLLDLAPSIYERCDDSSGTIGDIMTDALDNLATIAVQAKPDAHALADRVFAGVFANDYGQFDGIITLMAPPLGAEGLAILKARLEEMEATPPARQNAEDCKVIGINTRDPIYQDDFEKRHDALRLRSALTAIADALGDVDAYVARFSAEERTNPSKAADIAQRLLGANRPDEAMAALTLAEDKGRNGGYWPDWKRVRIDVLEAQGRTDEAQKARWEIFESSLNAEYLRAHLKRLPDFDDEEAENHALAYARQYNAFHPALNFLVDWPAHGLAADLVLARHKELNGDFYGLLTPAAEALEQKEPLAATLMLRSMIDFSLDHAKSTRYAHAVRHLQTCDFLAKRITDFGEHPNHDSYVANLKIRHARKASFWNT